MKILIGIVCVLIGAVVIYIHYKSPKTEFSDGNMTPNIKGYGSGIGIILIGVYFIAEWYTVL